MKAPATHRRAAKTVDPESIWRQECQVRREVLAQKQRMIDAMRGLPQAKREASNA